LHDPAERPDEFVERREVNQMIQSGLSTLPLEQRTILVLSDVQGLNYQEIAEITGLSLGTVKSRLSRGRARLRDYLVQQRELLPTRYRLRFDQRIQSVEDHSQ
jgi:RNA polymerase sigma-70 factor (ECF subfamily)